MSLRDDILKFWLPTRSSRLIAGLTLASVAVTTYLPEFLQRYDIPLSKEKTLLIRVSVPLLLLWIGTFITLLVVVRYSKTLKMPEQQPPPPLLKPGSRLFQFQEDILLQLFKYKGELYTFQLAQRLPPSEDYVKSHLEDLYKNKFIRKLSLPVKGLPSQDSWSIDDKGKKYLIENKLIS